MKGVGGGLLLYGTGGWRQSGLDEGGMHALNLWS